MAKEIKYLCIVFQPAAFYQRVCGRDTTIPAITVDSGLAQSSPFWVNSRFPERVKAEVLALLRLMAAAPSLADYNGSIKSGDLTLPLIYSQ